MRQFAEFYGKSTGWNGTDFSGPIKLIPACGSDSVLVIDGRLGILRTAEEARAVCRRRGYLGFTINCGARFTEARQVRKLETVG